MMFLKMRMFYSANILPWVQILVNLTKTCLIKFWTIYIIGLENTLKLGNPKAEDVKI